MRALTAVSLGALGLVSLAGSASAEPTTPDTYAGMPITDPAFEPEVIGVGHDPDVSLALDSPSLLFVNFDPEMMNAGCGNDARNDCSTIFSGPFVGYPGDGSSRAAVIQATRDDVEDFGVIVVGERPPNDQPYAMVVVGQPTGGSPAGVGGVAPFIDCGNTNPWITSFAFLLDSGANTLATVIHQEAAHTWGLEHVDDNTDNLFPSAGGTVDPKYTDACHQIVANTNLDPTGASCNAIHTLFCAANQQNSYQEMLALFGPPVPDLVPPTVAISSPAAGEEVDYNADFDLTFVLDDDRRPQIFDIVVYFDDVEATDAVLIDQEHSFPVAGGDAPEGHGFFNGPHTVRIEAFDEAGNVATDEVTFTIVGGAQAPSDDSADGSGGGEDGDGTGGGEGSGGGDGGTDATAGLDGGRGGDDGGCACHSADTPERTRAAWWWLAPLLLVRRRVR